MTEDQFTCGTEENVAKSIVRLDGFSDERLDYLEIQVDRQTWDEVCAPATHPTEGGSDE